MHRVVYRMMEADSGSVSVAEVEESRDVLIMRRADAMSGQSVVASYYGHWTL